MSDTTNQPAPIQAVPSRRKRAPRGPASIKPVFIIVQIKDDQGKPVAFNKKNISVVAVERSAEKVMDAIDQGSYGSAFYLRVVVPPTNTPRRQREPQAAAAD